MFWTEQSGVAVSDPEDALHSIIVRELQEPRSNHVVEPGRQPSAGHERRRGLSRIEEEPAAWTRLLEGERVGIGSLVANMTLHPDSNRLVGKHPALGLKW